MSLFGDLFDVGGFQDENSTVSSPLTSDDITKLDIPKPPRMKNGLCGIYNQGATCYLNSLLQTLLMTPEFREGLFQLTPSELGVLNDKDTPTSKVRIIPLELQRLFAQLLLLDQQGASTQNLTDSFGWTNNEELQQHDVQELNRILFSAIEDSLVGTSGQDLIKNLYHGGIVNQIVCLECERISEREEDFLDLCVAVSGLSTLQEALHKAFVFKEIMKESNQYKCDNCKKLVNASKGAKIRHLPPILTISLLRFCFDFTKMERYKETGKFVFSTELDMADYCENLVTAGDTEYELFSIVIHRGSGYGGHYHAFIRDVDVLGTWSHPDEEDIILPMDPSTGKVDYIEFDSPLELIQAILVQQPKPHALPVDKLCAELVRQTGVSWNKRFRKSYGPINKFVKKYDDKFLFDGVTVSLKSYSGIQSDIDLLRGTAVKEAKTGGKNETSQPLRKTRSLSPLPDPGWCWFDFDDSHVHAIRQAELERQFSGKESAYMLFYRQKSLQRPESAFKNPAYKVPSMLVDEVILKNELLQQMRKEYENKINSITVDVHFASSYRYRNGSLQLIPNSLPYIELILDRRKTVADLKMAILEMGASLVPEAFVIHIAKECQAGLHLYECVSQNDNVTIQETGVGHRSKLMVWDGHKIAGNTVPTGAEFEPVFITVTYGNPFKFSTSFPKKMTLGELKLHISNRISVEPKHLVLGRIVTKATEPVVIKFKDNEDIMTLKELNINDGANIAAETVQNKSFTDGSVSQHHRQVSFLVENRCLEQRASNWPVVEMEVSNDITVGELKSEILHRLQLHDIPGGGRLRIDQDITGLGPAVHENLLVTDTGLRHGQKLILEPGSAPLSHEITLIFSVAAPVADDETLEILIDPKSTVTECLRAMTDKAHLKGDNWHLRKTNFFGEAAQLLDDADETLQNCQLRDGDHLLLEVGKLPPKGCVKLTVYLKLSDSLLAPSSGGPGILHWLSSGVQGLLGGGNCSTSQSETFPAAGLMGLGEVVISKDATLLMLKREVMMLPQMEALSCLPGPGYLRLSLLENERCLTVLRGVNNSLQRLKLFSGCKLAAQLLQEEENLSTSQVVLTLQRRVVETRSYFPPEEFIYDMSRGHTPQFLRQAVAEHVKSSVDSIVIAKHFPEKYEWLVIKNDCANQKNKSCRNRKKKVNIQQAPYHIKDGDVIGVKDRTYDLDDKDDFMTKDDDAGLEMLKREAEEKKKKHEENRRNNEKVNCMGDGSLYKEKQPEPSIKIHVGNFR